MAISKTAEVNLCVEVCCRIGPDAVASGMNTQKELENWFSILFSIVTVGGFHQTLHIPCMMYHKFPSAFRSRVVSLRDIGNRHK